MRTCTVCKQRKHIKAFGFRDNARGRRDRTCKACVAAASRTAATPQAEVDRNTGQSRGERSRTLQARVWRYLAQHPCIDCGETDPIVLDFDQVEPDSSRDSLYQLVHQGASWSALLSEIGRCDVRCANCRRRRTAAQFGWARLQFGHKP
jgi:hypothetical protein